MTEILTESFCERCGTRYTFESARPKARLKGVKVLSRGLKNFVLSDDTSMNEAMAAARSEADREATAHQLDAFHKTFNFCMSCRQYSCADCWNEVEARCLSCAPLAVLETPVTLDDLTSLGTAILVDEPGAANGSSDDEAAALSAEARAPGPEVTRDESAGDPVAAADSASKAASQTTNLLRRFRPGEDLDVELEAFERQRADGLIPAVEPPAAERPAEPAVAALSAEAEPEADSGQAEPVAAEPEATAVEALAPSVESEPETEPVVQAGASIADVVEQPTWRITAPDTPALPGEIASPLPAGPTTHAVPGAEPSWPARPEWRTSTPTAGLPFLGRSVVPQGGIEALWAASNLELVTTTQAPGKPAPSGIQPCVSCGLSLSASARFCRRCGTVQQR